MLVPEQQPMTIYGDSHFYSRLVRHSRSHFLFEHRCCDLELPASKVLSIVTWLLQGEMLRCRQAITGA